MQAHNSICKPSSHSDLKCVSVCVYVCVFQVQSVECLEQMFVSELFL